MIKLKQLKKNGSKKYLNKKIFLILPILIFNAIFFFGSFVTGIFSSFGNNFYNNGWFVDKTFILLDQEIIRNIFFTLRISAFSTFFSLTIALFLLFIIFNHPIAKKYFKKILYLPLLTPYLLIAFFMMYAFSTSGLFNRILFSLGIVDNLSDGLILINDLNGKGIILAYIWKTTPFILLVLLNSLDHFDFRLLTIAESLGSSKLQSFYNIIWPHINSSFFYSGIIIFTFIFSAVEIPLILGPTRPQMIGHWAFQNFQNGEIIYRSQSLAIGTVILCLNIIITLFIGYKLLGQVTYEKNH